MKLAEKRTVTKKIAVEEDIEFDMLDEDILWRWITHKTEIEGGIYDRQLTTFLFNATFS